MDFGSLARKRGGSVRVISAGDRVSEVIGIGASEVSALGLGGDKEIKQDRGSARPGESSRPGPGDGLNAGAGTGAGVKKNEFSHNSPIPGGTAPAFLGRGRGQGTWTTDGPGPEIRNSY